MWHCRSKVNEIAPLSDSQSWNRGARFSPKAATASRWSGLPNNSRKVATSASTTTRVFCWAAFCRMRRFVSHTALSGPLAISSARLIAVCIRSESGTTRLTRRRPSGSVASTILRSAPVPLPLQPQQSKAGCVWKPVPASTQRGRIERKTWLCPQPHECRRRGRAWNAACPSARSGMTRLESAAGSTGTKFGLTRLEAPSTRAGVTARLVRGPRPPW